MTILLLAIVIGLLPAAIAHNKGRNFLLWWLYGAALWIVATPHSLMLKPLPGSKPSPIFAPPQTASTAEELERFANLRDRGAITEEEYAAKKRELLG